MNEPKDYVIYTHKGVVKEVPVFQAHCRANGKWYGARVILRGDDQEQKRWIELASICAANTLKYVQTTGKDMEDIEGLLATPMKDRPPTVKNYEDIPYPIILVESDQEWNDVIEVELKEMFNQLKKIFNLD